MHNQASAGRQLCIMHYELCIKKTIAKMENQEIKCPYQTPEIEVIELDATLQILAASEPLKYHHGEMD